jgi:succinoglycan biosynthesis transport protein ExoP
MREESRATTAAGAFEQGPHAYQVLGDILWRRKRRVVLFPAIGVALAVGYCFLFGPWYESSAQILVIKKQLETAPITDPAQGRAQEEYLSTHMLLLISPRVVGKAIDRGRLQELRQFRDGECPAKQALDAVRRCLLRTDGTNVPEDQNVQDLMRALTVSRDVQKPGISPSNEVLNLSFRGPVPEDCPRVLNAVLGSYQDCLQEIYRNTNTETLELITQARDVLQKDLAAKEAAYRKFLQTSPPVWRAKDGSTIHQDRLFNLDARRAALRMRASEIQASLKAVDDARAKGINPAGVLDLMAPLPPRQEVVAPNLLTNPEAGGPARGARGTLEEEFVNLQLQEKKLLEIYGYNHPEVKATQNRLETVRRMMAPSTPGPGDASGAELVRLKVDLLRQELRQLRLAEQSLTALFETEQKAAGTSFLHEVEDENHRKGIERSRLLYESILRRLEELNSVRDFGWYDTQLIGSPRRGEPATRKYLLVLGLGVFGGLLCGFGSAYAAESVDRRFRTAGEAGQRLGLPVIGQLPPARPGPEKLAPPGPSANGHLPAPSASAEAFRALRAVLDVRAGAAGAKVLQVTSPGAGEGKTTLATNLAVSIAQSGKTVVLVDADLRNPRLHHLWGVPGDVGLSSVLAGATGLEAALRPGPRPGLTVLPGGPLPASPAELLASPLLPEVLATLRQRYDYVLIDSPPLLGVADPAVLVPRVDQVLLTLRLSRTDRDQAAEARQLLDMLGARVLGVVIQGDRGRGRPAGYGR